MKCFKCFFKAPLVLSRSLKFQNPKAPFQNIHSALSENEPSLSLFKSLDIINTIDEKGFSYFFFNSSFSIGCQKLLRKLKYCCKICCKKEQNSSKFPEQICSRILFLNKNIPRFTTHRYAREFIDRKAIISAHPPSIYTQCTRLLLPL